MAYCSTVDLLLGDTPTSTLLDPAKYVADAADEIDSKIGFVYVTPIVTNVRPVTLLLKRINAHLASGRLILAATIAVESKQLNAYGQSLVDDAELAIAQIASGELPLAGAEPNPDIPVVPTGSISPTLISNIDPASRVENFYGFVGSPGLHYPGGYL